MMVNKPVDACLLPKTRFTSLDRSRETRSSSSPRLKSFPAEKIKKLETPPPYTPNSVGALIVQQNPRETGTVFLPAGADRSYNNGQGDTAAVTQPFQHQHHQQNMHAVSQQPIAPRHSIHPQAGQTNPNPDCTLGQVPNGQPHRPFVPHAPQKNTASTHSTPQGPTIVHPSIEQSPSNPGPTTDQGLSKTEEYASDGVCPDYEKQPIGGRNATLYRKMMVDKQQGHAQSQPFIGTDPSNPWGTDYQRTQSNYLARNRSSAHAIHQDPRQIYQQMQQNLAQQQQLQRRASNYQMQMMGSQQQLQGNQWTVPCNYDDQQFRRNLPGQGMTSPQDAAANQIKYPRMNVQHNYPVDQGGMEYATNQAGWPRSNQEAMESSNTQPRPLFRSQNQQHMFATQYQQQQQQHSLQQQQPTYQHQQLYRNAAPANATNENQQNSMVYPQQNQPSTVQDTQPAQHSKKKHLQFSASMIRDQEKLVATMKQQRVPVDVMRRQFDTLLNEQRRQLEYVEEIRRQEEGTLVKRPVSVARKRKPVDEKPEWMIHLTPSRLSYMELERLHELRTRQEQAPQFEQDQQLSETFNQQLPVPPDNQQSYQHYQFTQQPNWQRQAPQSANGAHPQPYTIPSNYHANRPVKPAPNVDYRYYQQPVPHPVHQQYQQIYRDSPQRSQQRAHPVNDPPPRQENRHNSEPSSLLKMRVYKQVIRPQRSNNGLQDPEVARKQLEQLKSSADVRMGLEYLARLSPNKQPVKLNGTQDRNEMEEEWRERLIASSQQSPSKRIPANGLMNERGPNNPHPQRQATLRKMGPDLTREYPRQKQYNPRNCYSLQAEREHSTGVTEQQAPFAQYQAPGQNSAGGILYNEKNPLAARCNLTSHKFDGAYPLHYQQMQQYYQNAWNLGKNSGQGDVAATKSYDAQGEGRLERAGGDASENFNPMVGRTLASALAPDNRASFQRIHRSQPDLHEARTIGGIKYLARRQDCIPNTQFVSPETILANRHLQPPMMY
ncbi:uncharacterized protein LOC143376544 [Andrena cerasifolii]|uniref:uncharacterized protein LOC143376544 n=1 Tax=Andrena cerasifolii TaxID=2819439 RepID=UPI004037E941